MTATDDEHGTELKQSVSLFPADFFHFARARACDESDDHTPSGSPSSGGPEGLPVPTDGMKRPAGRCKPCFQQWCSFKSCGMTATPSPLRIFSPRGSFHFVADICCNTHAPWSCSLTAVLVLHSPQTQRVRVESDSRNQRHRDYSASLQGLFCSKISRPPPVRSLSSFSTR